ncbi:SGNH/GDSL hydrolase family protein [Streptomyces sp. AC627_RSS907]|uniref:SGNH/GDSL hydrolase family protein n=1 Tax=Streptomyces sp. AC627_RSS907 TaxID=2823684 RepID=UPI001C2351B2|nr:SGNH/GDSL hydrolase family protein [Streptomyces sp. AC627_RSS907]
MNRSRRRLALSRRTTLKAAAVTAASASLLTAGAVTGSAVESTPRAERSSLNYVALGDSYASGMGLGSPTNADCNRSSRAYPVKLKELANTTSFKNVTCSGATTRSLWNTEGSQPPQINALSKDTDLVTVTLGGNDVGFAEVMITCALTNDCQNIYKSGGTDQLKDRINKLAPRIKSMVTDIKRHSPKAKVMVVGYPKLFPSSNESHTCSSSYPLSRAEMSYLDGVNVELNRQIAQQTRAAGGEFVDMYTRFKGHDMCQTLDKRYINPVSTDSGSVHPNAAGHKVMAEDTYLNLWF